MIIEHTELIIADDGIAYELRESKTAPQVTWISTQTKYMLQEILGANYTCIAQTHKTNSKWMVLTLLL